MIVFVARLNSGRNDFEDFGRYGILPTWDLQSVFVVHLSMSSTHLVVSDKVIRAHPLDLGWTQHPAYVVDDLDVLRGGLRDRIRNVAIQEVLIVSPFSAVVVLSPA